MDFRKFEELVIFKVKENTEEGAEVLPHSVTKNNGLRLNGIIILRKGEHMSPTIYLEKFYEEYRCGRSIESIVSEIMKIYNEQRGQIEFDPARFRNINDTREQIMFKIINFEQNKELLKLVPHRSFLDLAIVYYVVVTTNEIGMGSILVKNEHLDLWKITEEELYEYAINNTPQKLPYELKSMTNMILELMDRQLAKNGEISTAITAELIAEIVHEVDESNSLKMYVLTNNLRINGAGTILYKNVLRDFSRRIKADLYILPSSIHEGATRFAA